MGGNHVLEVLLHRMMAAGQGGMDVPDVPLSTWVTIVSSIDRIGGEPDPAAEQDQRTTVLLVEEEVTGGGAHPHQRPWTALVMEVVGGNAGRSLGGIVRGPVALDTDAE
jgi:hypothetical protein